MAEPPPPPTDDPPQPRGPGVDAWPRNFPPIPAAIDPRLVPVLPTEVQPESPNASADNGLFPGAVPTVHVIGEVRYSFGLAASDTCVFAPSYSSSTVKRFRLGSPPLTSLGAVAVIHPKSELYGLGGVFSTAVDRATGTLYLAYDGVGAGLPYVGMVRALRPDGTERVVVTGLTTPKQMTVDACGRLYIVEEGAVPNPPGEQLPGQDILRWDPKVCSAANATRNWPGRGGCLVEVVHRNETVTVEGVAARPTPTTKGRVGRSGSGTGRLQR